MKMSTFGWMVLVFGFFVLLVVMTAMRRIRRHLKTSVPAVSGATSEEELQAETNLEEVEEISDEAWWNETQKKMEIGRHYAIYDHRVLGAKELDIIFDYGWRFCEIDRGNGYCAYHFEKMPQ
ncbi:MAG: hypothetical protein V1686_01780 [Patescibacteria group bacterium]